MTDYSWNAIHLMILTQAETGTYLICACLPTYRRFVLNCSFRGKTQHTHTHTGGTSPPTFYDFEVSSGTQQKQPTFLPQRPGSAATLGHTQQYLNDMYPLTFVPSKETSSHHHYPSYASSSLTFRRSSSRLNESPSDTVEQHLDHAESQDLE